MQTFLPYPNYALSAHVLDSQRLGKQRVECMQILRSLAQRETMRNAGWLRHPAVQMWRGHERSLMLYLDCCITEWVRRGYNNTMLMTSEPGSSEQRGIPETWLWREIVHPAWLGHERMHASHRAALLHKDPAWYAQFCWDEHAVLDYWWPGPRPEAGQQIVNVATGQVLLVLLSRDGVLDCSDEATGDRCTLPEAQVTLRVWDRARGA